MLAAVSKPRDPPPEAAGRAGGRPPGASPAEPCNAVADPLLADAQRAAAGDRDALRRVLRALAPRLLATIRAVVGASSPEVEDVLQESLMAVSGALASFRGESTLTHYACRIAARTAIAARKRRAGRELLASDEDERERAFEGPSPAQAVLAGRQRRVLRELLMELNEDQAETLTLRVVLGMSLDEVARATGVPLNTVRSRVRLAKEALRRRIEAEPALQELLGGAR